MPVHAGLRVGGFLLLGRIAFAVPTEGPGPAARHHQRLQVVVAGKALRHGSIVARVVVDLLAGTGLSAAETRARDFTG
jgi:hypothetical protein